jgi:hypothetical protein
MINYGRVRSSGDFENSFCFHNRRFEMCLSDFRESCSAMLEKWKAENDDARAYKSLLEARQPLVIQSKVGTSEFWYRVRVVSDTRTEADKLCSGLRAAGASCLVQRN